MIGHKRMEFLIVHPYKHHAFNLMAGLLLAGKDVHGAFPLYQKGLGALLPLVPGSVGRKAMGYSHKDIPINRINSNIYWQLRKLATLANNPQMIEAIYDEYCSKMIISQKWVARTIITLQDHMPKTSAAAKTVGSLLWSDQILNLSRNATARIDRHLHALGLPSGTHNEDKNNQIIAAADIISVPSTYMHEDVVDRARSNSEIIMVPYGVDVTNFNPSQKIKKNARDISIVARANSVRKGGHLLLNALEKFSGDLLTAAGARSINVLILGSLDKDLKEIRKNCVLPKSISIRDAVIPHADVPHVLQNADFFVMPTLTEGMSLALPEAMASGLPSMTTKYCGVDYFQPSKTGILVEDTVDSVGEGLVEMISQEKNWSDWSKSSRNLACEYGWKRYEVGISLAAKNMYLSASNKITSH